MEDVSAGWHFSDFGSIGKSFHADDTLGGVELVQFFVILFEFKEWDEFGVLIDQRHMHLTCHFFPIIPLAASLLGSLSNSSPVACSSLLVNVSVINHRFIASTLLSDSLSIELAS